MTSETTETIIDVLGKDAFNKLVTHYGGTRFNVPVKPKGQTYLWICNVIGVDATDKLVSHMSGENITVPRYSPSTGLPHPREQRNIDIIKEYDSGVTAKKLARKYELTERTVYSILNKG